MSDQTGDILEVKQEQQGDTTLLSFEGRLDSNTSQGLEQTISGLIDGGVNSLVINFSALTYISSAGLRVILIAAKRLKAGSGKLVLCGMQEHIFEVFQISGFLSVLTIVKDVSTAVEQAGC